jgi:hypothetical protein
LLHILDRLNELRAEAKELTGVELPAYSEPKAAHIFTRDELQQFINHYPALQREGAPT